MWRRSRESYNSCKLLPDEIGGQNLRKQAFTGKVWLKARPEADFAPEVSADISKFLDRLRKSPSDLSVAWALAPDGPKIVAYRVTGTTADALVKSFVEAVRERTKIRTVRTVLAGKNVTVTLGASIFRGYVYTKDDVLYATNTSHVTPQQLKELLRKLP